MKVLYCGKCGDLFGLIFDQQTCHCGNVSGYYKENGDDVYIEVMDKTKAKLIGISNLFLQMPLHKSDIWVIPFSHVKVELVELTEIDNNHDKEMTG